MRLIVLFLVFNLLYVILFACFLNVADNVLEEFEEYYFDIIKIGKVMGHDYNFDFINNLHRRRD